MKEIIVGQYYIVICALEKIKYLIND